MDLQRLRTLAVGIVAVGAATVGVVAVGRAVDDPARGSGPGSPGSGVDEQAIAPLARSVEHDAAPPASIGAPPTTAATTTTEATTTTSTAPPPTTTAPATTAPAPARSLTPAAAPAAPAPPPAPTPPPTPAPPPSPTTSPDPGAEATLLALINQHRASQGVAPLRSHGGAATMARHWATQLAQEGRLRHHPDPSGALAGHGVTGWVARGEVVGYGSSVEQVLARFKSSPDHNRILLDPALTHAGAGAVRVGGTVWVAVELVGL